MVFISYYYHLKNEILLLTLVAVKHVMSMYTYVKLKCRHHSKLLVVNKIEVNQWVCQRESPLGPLANNAMHANCTTTNFPHMTITCLQKYIFIILKSIL